MMPQYPETDNELPHNPACASSLSKGGVVISLRNSAITKEIEIMSSRRAFKTGACLLGAVGKRVHVRMMQLAVTVGVAEHRAVEDVQAVQRAVPCVVGDSSQW